ncbi:hypothetical protein GCM10027416_14520 [Okibacterium endophyticum]
MEWWNQFVSWLISAETRPVLFTSAVLIVSIIVAALIAASITKAAVRRLVAQRDREMRASAIAALVDASTEAAVWNSLTPGEQVLADRAVGQADIYVRLLPLKGAATAANWAAHQLAEMKRQSATFGYELAPMKAEFRDRLLDWQHRPGRAKRIFESDLERWQFETTDSEKTLIAEQDAWATRQQRQSFENDAAALSDEPVATTPPPSLSPATFARQGAAAGDAEAQRLIDDVAAMEVRRSADDAAAEKDAS